VEAQLDVAMRDGDVCNGLAGLTPRGLLPADYPAPAVQPGPSRAQVRAELAAAQRAGDWRIGLAGLTPRELFPGTTDARGNAPAALHASAAAMRD
jgi:hypothetical protein